MMTLTLPTTVICYCGRLYLYNTETSLLECDHKKGKP